jgi:hypothetical protein
VTILTARRTSLLLVNVTASMPHTIDTSDARMPGWNPVPRTVIVVDWFPMTSDGVTEPIEIDVPGDGLGDGAGPPPAAT